MVDSEDWCARDVATDADKQDNFGRYYAEVAVRIGGVPSPHLKTGRIPARARSLNRYAKSIFWFHHARTWRRRRENGESGLV